jgi:HEAT repeat protein
MHGLPPMRRAGDRRRVIAGQSLRLVSLACLATVAVACAARVPAGYQGRKFEDWRADLRKSDPHARAAAAYALRFFGAPAVPPLLEVLNERDSRVFFAAQSSLGFIGPPARDPLVNALQDRSALRRIGAVGALGVIGKYDPTVLPHVTLLLDDPDKTVRVYAIRALGRMGAPAAAAAPALSRALDDPDVRAYVVEAIGLIGVADRPTIEAFTRELKDPTLTASDWLHEWSRRSHVVNALGRLGPAARGALPALLDILANPTLRKPEYQVYGAVVKALVRIDPTSPDVVHALIQRLDDSEFGPKPTLNGSLAAMALGVVGSLATPDLIEALHASSPRLRATAALALGQVRPVTSRVVPALIRSLKEDVDPHVRGNAAFAFMMLGSRDRFEQRGSDDARMVSALVQALRDPDPEPRASAARALGEIGSRDRMVIDALLAALEHPDWSTRGTAAEALGQVAPPDPAVIDALVQLLPNQEALWAARGLARLGPAANRELLWAARDSRASVRLWANHALLIIRALNPPTASRLARALTNDERIVREWAAEMLARLNPLPDEVVPVLMERLRWGDELRQYAARGLSHMKPGQPDATAALIRLLDDSDEGVEAFAAIGVMRLGPPREALADLERLARERTLEMQGSGTKLEINNGVPQLRDLQ